MVLDENNYLLYAMHHYSVPSCPTLEEFENDLRLVTYIKKGLANPEQNTRRLLNHVITIFNCFGDAALHMLFHRIEKEHWPALITFLLYISRMPDEVPEYGISIVDVKLNEKVIQELRKL